jgi:hypothetical protein
MAIYHSLGQSTGPQGGMVSLHCNVYTMPTLNGSSWVSYHREAAPRDFRQPSLAHSPGLRSRRQSAA